MAKFCSSCGAPLEEGMRFCEKCGTPQVVENQSATIQISRAWRFVCFLFDAEVYIDDVKIGTVGNGKSQTFTVSPGAHKLQLKLTYPLLTLFTRSEPKDFQIRGGETLKFNCDYTFGTFATITGFHVLIALAKGFKDIKVEQMR